MSEISVTGGGVPSLTNTLTDTHIFVGDSNNEPADVALTLSPTGGTFALANTGVLTMPNADAVTRGLLTAADWNTFNNKQNAIADWTTAFNSGTQATSSWTATNAAANVNAAIRPKGTGAIIAAIPDGTVTGGNARGTYAVDLQMSRVAATQVASGNYSVIAGGLDNTSGATGTFIGGGWNNSIAGVYSTISGGRANSINAGGDKYAVIGGGFQNTLTGDKAFIGGGQSNTASGTHSVVGGGQNNTASGTWNIVCGGNTNSATGNQSSVVVGGTSNSASQSWSSVVGGVSNSVSGLYTFIGGGTNNYATGSYSSILGGVQGVASLYGQQVHASGRFSANGDAQAHELIWRRLVTGAPVGGTELFLDGASAAAILPATNSIWHGIIDIAAVCTATGDGTTVTGDVEATSYKVTIKRIGTTTSLVGTVQEIGTTNADASMASGVFTIDNNDTNESLRIVYTSPVTAGTTTTIRVVATFRGLQIQY